ncbi:MULTISPECIES: hypothetical protein [unclassified Ruminococcus]|uniref:hypothetical protein n=1 Tax=unclassified Ruminococcus TaxID=2608920 RepID=UPI00210E7001|nr:MULTISPECIES: hypothetical protein [unclassified Ruminococcus]MCQ4022070.1 hypothetical protein [Ruminococcus sp. zg-924]MCQ4114390.1 hypothetical protein [Ruminococcus sp. zg-921]
MKSIKKTVAFVLCALTLLSSAVIASAAETANAEEETITVTAIKPGDEPQGDQIYWKYRKYFGVLQKRRWNATKRIWVDKAWINV